MKILILGSKEFPIGTSNDTIPSGGMEFDINKIVPELAKRGVEVHVITRKFSGAQNYEKRGNIHIYRVPWIRGVFFRNYSFNIMSFFKALEVIRKKKIQVVQTVGVVASLAALILKLFTGVKVLAEPRGAQIKTWWFPFNLVLGLQELIAYSLADAVSVQSEEQKVDLEKALRVKFKNAVVIPTGIPHNRELNPSKIKKELRLKKEKVVTFVGRFHPVKGIEYLIQAVKILNDPKLKFILVGDGIQMPEIRRLVRNNNLESKIILTGWRDDVPDILAASDIYVLSSLSEGLPTSLLEAMAIGLPCIVTDIDLPIKHMETGLVVPPKSPEAIADSIKKLLDNSKLRKTLGKEGHKYLVAHHSMLASTNKYIEVYKELAK